MNKIITKAVSVLSIFAIICTMIPVGLVASAAENAVVQIENASGLGTKNDMTIGNGYTIHANNYWCMIHTEGSKQAVYCLEPGKTVSTGDKYDQDLTDKYLENIKNSTLDSSEIRRSLGQVFLYSYTGSLDSVDAYNRYVATQMLVWEVIVGQRDLNFNRVNNGYTLVENMLGNFQSDYAGQVVSGYYYEYESQIKAHSKAVSFAKISTNSAEKNAVIATSDGTYTFTDSNNVLANFDATVTNGSVVSKSNNILNIKADDGKIAMVTLTQNNVSESGELTGFLTLTNDSTQTLAELKADPRKYYVAVKGLENGNLEIIKTSEDGIIADISFVVTGNGNTYNVKTDKNGKINILNLKAGEYSVTEVVPVRYETQQTKKVTVQAGKTASISFSNTLKKGTIKINKQSEDGENGGRTFEISGNGKMYTINTNNDGVAILSDIPVFDSDNSKIVYTISEKNVPVKYVVPADQTTTLTAYATTTKTFKNILKKFTVEVTKKDSEVDNSGGNATLSGAVYGVFQGDKLIDTYSTNANGYFKTREYICGDDWTIKEISASEGYLLDEKIHKIGTQAKNYTIEKNNLKMTVYEEIIKGNIEIIKHNDDGSTQIETPEIGAKFEVYLKSAGSYKNAKSTEKDTLICDEFGYAKSKDLPYGIYIVHQIMGNEGVELMGDFDVKISENSKTYRYLINNSSFKALVKIVKKDAETGEIIPVSGIGFKVWDKANNGYVSQIINYPTQVTIDEFYTDESGSLMMPSELVYGDYELHEIQTADGYFLGTKVVPFSVDGTEKNITVEKFNIAQKGRISVKKMGKAFTNVAVASSAYTNENGNMIVNPTTYSPIFSEVPLADALFQIIANEDIITADGTIRVRKGEVVAQLKTNENGYGTSDLLYLGEYEIKEIFAPYGYVLNAESDFVELTYAGQEIEVRETVETAFENEYQNVEISLEKWLETDDLFGIGSDLEYTNIRFGLFADEEIMAADGTVIPEGGLIAEVALDSDSKAVFTEKIPIGRYYVQEISTDEGYVLNGEKYLVNFEYMGQECETVYLSANDGISIKNHIIRGSVEGKKVSESDEPLANAIFGLFAVDCTKFTTENAYLTAISDENGRFSFENIPFGKYAIREIEAPVGYVLSNEIFEVEVMENGQVIEIVAENKLIRGNVSVTKIDEEYPENKLSGAEFTVYADEEGTREIGKLEEIDKGMYTFDNLEYGRYFLKETVAPDGFVLDENVYEFEILENGKTVEITNTEAGNGFANAPITGTAEITKKDVSDGKLIPDCGIEILSKDGNVIFRGRTDENGVATFEKLRYGEYFYREFDAPNGYILDETAYPFSITEDGEIIKCEMTNEKIPTPYYNDSAPKTGDNFPMKACFAVIGSTLAMLISSVSKKKKRG